jgi:HEAT repeat protein
VDVLANPAWASRQLAVKFIAVIPSREATAVMITALADGDNDVRSTAVALLKTRTLADTEVAPLQSLSTDSKWQTRQPVANFLGTIRTDRATSALIPMIGDGDNDVRGSVAAALNGRAFNDAHVDALGTQLNGSNWSSRQLAAKYLGTTSSCNALRILKGRLAVESDSDVTAALKVAIQAVQGRTGSCQ